MNVFKRSRTLVAGLAAVFVIAGCTGGGGDGSPAASEGGNGGDGGDGGYAIGVSNTVQGNGWREEMICSIKAQAAVSGEVERLNIQHRNTDAAGQLEDLRNLITDGVDAIIVNPVSPDAVNVALEEAMEAGITVVAVDQAVTAEGAYLLANNQEEYGYLGAKWLFEQLGGSGDVLYMRGFDGHPADADRNEGFQAALADYPDINIVQEVFTGWDPSTGAQQALDILSTQQVDGIWTSGIDFPVVEQFEAAGHPYVPIVGADNNGFIQQLIELEEDGLTGAIVTNPPPVGGVATAIAVDQLTGAEQHDQNTLLTPEVYDNIDGLSTLEQLYQPDLPQGFVSTMEIEPWTTYTQEDVLDCRGPGE